MKSNRKLIAGCKLWDKITEKMNRGEYLIPEHVNRWDGETAYSDLDYAPLKCIIDGEHAEVTVGDAADHKTHIDLARQNLDYHDPDTKTNRGVYALFTSIGLKCRMHDRGVICSGVTEAKAKMLFKALGMVPSMDRRLEHCLENLPWESELVKAAGGETSFCIKQELKFFKDGAKKEKA